MDARNFALTWLLPGQLLAKISLVLQYRYFEIFYLCAVTFDLT